MHYYEVSEAVNRSLRFNCFIFAVIYAAFLYLKYPDLNFVRTPKLIYYFITYIFAVGVTGFIVTWMQQKFTMWIFNRLENHQEIEEV